MNKTFVTFFMFSLAALPAWAASTCETRVDSHQDATTKQRVAYCLTPEAEAPAAPGPELVYYGVSSSKPAEEPQTEEQKREWVKKHIGNEVFVNCCLSKDKPRYCAKGDILIDDFEPNIREWEKAGGIGILHKNATDTIEKLNKIAVSD